MKKLRTQGRIALILGVFGLLGLPAAGCEESPAGSPAVTCGAVAAQANPDGLIASAEPGWPQWRGTRRDGISDASGLLQSWPEAGPKLLWKIGNLGLGWSSPIIVRDRLYITGDADDDLVVFAFDLNGTLKWQANNGKAWKGSYPGARACCVYSEAQLYHMNAHGRVACLDAATGKELWALDVLDRFQGNGITWGTSECLLVDGTRLIVTPGGTSALMAALDKTSGRVVWTTQPLSEDQATYCSPILLRYAGHRLLVNCSSGHGFAVDADSGKLLWTVPLRNRHGVNVATPAYGDGCVFLVTADGPGGALYRLRAHSRRVEVEQAWKTPLDTCTGGVVLAHGLLYGSGYRKFKSWLCLDWNSGQKRHELKQLTTGSAIYADGRLYCLAEDGRVVLLKPTSGELEITGQFRLVPDKPHDAWAHPVLLHGRLYLRYHDMLWCYDVRAE